MGYNVQQKLLDNIAALRIALAHKSGDDVDESKEEILKKYSGFGGINLTQITAVEKDILTSKVLSALTEVPGSVVKVHASAFEKAPVTDNGQY